MRIERGPGWELRLGPWRKVMRDVVAQSLITDPPYSPKTHAGYQTTKGGSPSQGSIIGYASLMPSERGALIRWASWARWQVVFSDDDGGFHWRAAMKRARRYTFHDVVMVKSSATPRILGDGPNSTVEHIAISRLRGVADGALQGHYLTSRTVDPQIIGQKPIGVMRALVRDYSRPGDVVVDPYAGTGTTLLAALMEGRTAIGSEVDPQTFALAVERLRAIQIPLFVEDQCQQLEQQSLLGDQQ